MIYFFTLAFLLMGGGFIAWFYKNYQLREIQQVFRDYNEQQNEAVLLDWIRAKNTAQRLVRVLDYLCKIEDEALAVTVFEAFDSEDFPQRHIRTFAAKALASQGHGEGAIKLVEGLSADFPGDDAILELSLDIYLRFQNYRQARELLNQRMTRKYKGTVFLRFHSQLLAAEGDLEEAIKVLEQVVEKDRVLYQNTFAPPHKKLIYDQYITSQTLLDELRDRLSGAEPEASA